MSRTGLCWAGLVRLGCAELAGCWADVAESNLDEEGFAGLSKASLLVQS